MIPRYSIKKSNTFYVLVIERNPEWGCRSGGAKPQRASKGIIKGFLRIKKTAAVDHINTINSIISPGS